jgi:hypothetical protein
MDKRIDRAVLEKSNVKGKRYKMTFLDEEEKKVKTTNFGSSVHENFTMHKDPERKDRYLKRHKNDPTDPTSAG